jgi:mercuric reductase
MKFDYIIIGAGSAGFAAAIKANELGIKTALINGRLPLGGTCVNVGCVPSKTLLHIAQTYWQTTHQTTPGLYFKKVILNFPEAIEHELKMVETMQKLKYRDVLAQLKHITFFEGKAKFIGKNEIIVKNQTLQGKKFLIANGSTASSPPIPGIDKISYITHFEALKIKKLPKSLIVIGGGAVALEFAQMYHHFGSKVTILQRSRLIKDAEPEISRELVKIFNNEGIEVCQNLEFVSAKQVNKQKKIRVKLANGEDEEFVADELLIGTGKRANTADLGLETVEVLTEKGKIKIGAGMRTNIDYIWAAGDVVSAPKRLETTAAKEGKLATENALANANRKITYTDIPSVIFTTPAVASVGLTDKQAVEQGIECRCTTLSFEMVPKAKIIGDTRGVIKMVIDKKTRKILGVHILAKSAQELIHEATLAVKFDLTIEDIRDTVHVFPTLSEAIKLVAQSFDKDLSKLSCCIE